jgi:hypothetical protein
MIRYKLRAECPVDSARLLLTLVDSGIDVTDWIECRGVGDDEGERVVTFKCAEPIQVLKHAIASIVDGHVMLETIARAEDYTGERSYEEPARLS